MMWLLILGFAVLLPSSEGSHFRGAIISWKPTANYHEILITFRISWRRSYDNLFCDDNTIRTRNLIGVSDDMTCLDSCHGRIGSVKFYCTDYSVLEDWTSGKNSFTYTSNSDHFEFGYKGQAWIEKLREGGGGDWMLRVTVDLKVRSDTGKVNSSPETNMKPITELSQGCQHTISIPVYDDDGDIVRCRKAASYIKDECGGICNAFPAVFVEDACLIIFNATYAGVYGVAIQIEDFPNANTRQPLSSIPLQFLVNVSSSPQGCVASPEFLPPTRPKDSCIGVPTGTTYFEPIVAQSHVPGENITEITTASIPGMTKSPLAKYPESASAWYVNISWTPMAAQSGQTSIFCFTARDTLSLTTDQRCIKLVGGEAGPTIINGTQSPTGIIFLNHRHFSVQFDQEFVRPKESRFIYIYNQNKKLVESVNTTSSRNAIYGDNNKLEFITSSTFEDQMTYYVLFQSGVVIGKTFCGIESPPIHDQVFWTFMAITPDTTPPVLTFTVNPFISNGNITIQWHFNERATARCWGYGPTLIESAGCNGSWTGSNLREGPYQIYIEGRDLAGNIANPVQHVFNVDRTSPKVTITNRPHAVSNERTVDFQMNCDESCYMECSVHEEPHNHTDFATCYYNSFSFSSSFHVPNLISNRTYIFEVRARDPARNIGESVKYTWQTDFVPPEINCNFISRNLSCTSNTNPSNLGRPYVKDNIASKENISLTYSDSSQTNSHCMLHRQWTAIDTAGNSASCTQNATFYSPGPLVLERSPDHAFVACGELTDMNEVFKQMFLVHSPCGLPTEISYMDDHSEKIDVCGATLNRTWTVTDNCGKPGVHTQLIHILGVQKPITPTSGERGIDLRYTLRWSPYEGSSSYQVYIWKVGNARPNTSIGMTTYTYFTPPKPLDAGTKYFWQVEFILQRVNKTLFGPKWGFETRSFIDLIVKTIEVPPVTYSGQSFDVKWTIQNIGNLSTETNYRYWYDHVYLSFTNNFGTSRYVGHKMQRTILFPGDAYSSQMTVLLRQDDLGHAYIFVYTDKDNYITEINKDNNLLKSSRSVDVMLTPPPDLRVTGIKVSSRSISGGTISVHWTVINSGTGITPPSQSHWYDRIYLSDDQSLDSSDAILETVVNSRVMTPTEQYSKSQQVQIPEYITGTFWILIKTDSMNNVYEHQHEENNVNASENSTYIIMQPIPDLQITEINIPEEVRTGNDLTIQWQVTNTGADTARGPWYDQVTMTQMTGTLSLNLGYNLQYYSISPGVGYHSSVTTTIPPTLPSGAYLVTVDIDYENRIFEFNSKTNNRKAKKILVRQALPNLSVDTFRMNLITIDNINYVEVYAKILNTGQGKTYPPLNWIDSIDAINSESYYENNLARFSFSFRDGILPGSNYEINKTLEIPLELHGSFTFSITVDKFQNIEETNRADNRKAIGPKAVSLLAPDLFLSVPSMEHIVQAGQSLLVSYMVKNIGSPIKERTEWIDHVILSMSRTDVRDYIMFAEMIRTESSTQNGAYNGTIMLNIPKNVVGEFYIHIVINNRQLLYEGQRFENNKIALPIMIDRFPSPDLAVIGTVIEQNINPELKRILVVSWTVRNQGNSMTSETSWTDSILLSSELQTTKFNFTVMGALEISGEYYMKRTIVIPESFVGNYSINVKTNSLEEIDELGETANNIGPFWNKVTFDEIPVAILSSSIISVVPLNDTITTGRSVKIVCQVTNIGHARTTKQSWIDVIFASKKESQSLQEIKKSGTILQSMTHIGSLGQGRFYTHEIVLVVPVDYNATSFFYMVADFDTSMDDADAEEHTPDTLGNISISNSSQLILPPLKLPNLIPTITTLNNNSLRGGQPFTFEYQIQNIGNGQIKSSWYDSIYLSDDFEMDPFDTKIITVLRKASIAVNGSTNFSTTVFIPFDLESKNYFLMIFVDSRNEIFEEDENDNNLPISIFIEQSVSTDIAINKVNAPSATVYGDSMTIEWTIINNGSRKAFGYKCDTVYFSKDNVLSTDDIQIADSLCNDISLAPYSNTSEVTRYNITERTPLASVGSYKAIIRSRSNIFDSNQNNNILASNNSTWIDVKMLSLGIIESFNITPGKDMEYRVANISADQTLVINLNTADNEALFALYVKYGAPATKYDFDYRSDDNAVQNHTIIYPATKSGEFYLLVVYSGSSAMNSKSASVSLFAKLASFEILGAFPHTAAPLGNITMGIKGTLIPEDVQAFLFSKTINISASFVYYFSSVSVYATFDITHVSIGESFSLHLCSETHSMNATLSGALKTIQGAVGEFSIKMSQPSQVLIGMTSTVTIDIENIGDTDIQSPLLLVNVEGEGLIKFITDVKETYYMKNYIIFSPPANGPGGIFAPQAYTRLLFEAKQTNLRATRIKITVFLIQPNNESFGGILDHESLFKPSNYEESTWKTIWTNFRALVGETTSTISKKLCEVSNQFSLAGRRVHLFKDYLNLLLEVSDGALGDKVVVWASDIDQMSQENPKIQLVLERYVSSKIGIRALDGPLGKGWILPYWSTFIKTINISSAILYIENVAYEYIKTREGVYMNKLGPDLLAVKSGYVLTDTVRRRTLHFDTTTLRLRSIISLIDSSRLEMQYDDYLRLVKVRHSDGGYMDVDYDSKNRISVIQTKNDTVIGHKTMLYSYHETKNLLMSVTINEETTYYDYDENMNLVAVRNADGSVFTAAYSKEGFLANKTYTLSNGTLQESTQFSYDHAAMVKVTTNPKKTNTFYTLDENAEVIAMKKDGSPTVKFMKTVSSKFTIANDRVIQSTIYDKEKHTVRIEDANSDSITVMYGSSEDMEALYDGGGNMYKFERNVDHSISRIIYPDGSDRKFVYNSSSLEVISQTGRHKKYVFNKDHQITLKDIGDGWPSSFEYDTNGRMVKVVKGTSITFGYEQSLPSSITHENGRVINYLHGKNYLRMGNRASFKLENTVPYLYDVEYKYDLRGNLIEVWDKIMLTKLLMVDYDSRGRVSRKILGNGAKTEYQYNQQTGFLEALFNYHVNGTLSSKFEYEYDTYQRRIKLHTLEGTYKFQYDPSGQLTMVENPLGVVTEYRYDNRKNRIQVKRDGNESLYSVNMLNQYERLEDMTFEYDKNGNLIKKTGAKTRKLLYNEDNQLLSIETHTMNCSLAYDALGSLESLNCTDASGNSSQRHYLTDTFGPYGSDVLMQIYINGTDTKVTSYFHGADQLGLIAMRMDGDYFYFQFDPIGSVVMILNSSEVLNSYHYDTFGLAANSHESLDNPFKFVGQCGVMQIPGISELYFMRARFYDAEIGRFISVDPLGIGGMSKNLYVYAYNNPVHLRDPSGKIIWVVPVLGGGALSLGKYVLMSELEGKDITWGGATKAFVDGVIDSAVSELKTVSFIGKLGVSIGKGLYHTFTDVIQHKIDHTPYNWDQFWHDLKENELSEIKSTVKDSFLDLVPKPVRQLVKVWEKVYEVCQEHSDNCRPVRETIIGWVRSHDPNDIISPAGYGAARFIAKDTVLEYTIRFENDENATASAQRVFIEHTFDEDLDLRSFRLGSYGFGNFTKELSFQSSIEQTTVNLTVEDGIYIRVVAGVDLVKKQATWEFQAIDMDTGLPPTNISKGFLPPNNGTSGQGFVHFSIKVKADAPTLSRIDANATIYFDMNDPIDTPDVFNTIDDSAPKVTTTVIKDALSEGILVLSFNSTDVGAGVQEIKLYSREVEGYILLKAGIKESLTSLNLNQGKNYTLLPLPVDYVGNRLQINDTAEYQFVFISIPQPVGTCSCSGHGNCSESGSICSCDAGFFGSFCNETVKPQYPPMLEVRVIDGYEDEPLQVYLSAKNISGPVDRLYLQVEGFPNETLFSKGNVSQSSEDDDVLYLEQGDFGSVNVSLPKGFSGRLSLEITAFAEEGNKTQQQRRNYTVYIEPQFTFDIKACLSENRTESVAEIRVEFNFTETNMSGLLDIAFMPPYLKLSKGQTIEFGRFQLTDADLGDVLYVQADTKYSNIQLIEISLDFTVFDNLKSHWKVYHKARTIKCQCDTDCKTTTTRMPTTQTVTDDVGERITTLKVIFDYDIPTQDDLNDMSVYEKYLSEIKAVLMQLFKIKLGGHLQNINILFISRGSLIVEFEIITDATMDTTSQLSASLLSLQSMQLLGRPSRLMSLTFLDNNVTVNGGSNLNECTFNMYISPCLKNYECQVENGLPVCREVVSEVKLFSLDDTTRTIVIASMGGLFGLIVLIFVIFMISYICRHKKERKKLTHHPQHKGMARTQETQFNHFRDGKRLNHQEENMRMY